MSYFLCAAGVTMRNQFDDRWPKRDRASDGWIGDASHQAVPSDHNPDWDDPDNPGVVRAIDIDSDLTRSGDGDELQRALNQLLTECRKGRERRIKYVIYRGRIASGTYSSAYWTWRSYSGSDPHTNHGHVSFADRGDENGHDFDVDIFTSREDRKRSRIRAALGALLVKKRDLMVKIEQKRRKLRKL